MTADPMETPTIFPLAEGFCVRQAVDVIAWIDLGDGGLVVDALEQAHLEEEVFAAIAETLGDKPVKYVLNTHPHGDHTALNAAFGRRWGAEIVSQRSAAITPEGRWFEGPKRRVLFWATPGCHTPDDCCAWVEPDKALFVGDIFGWGLIPLGGALTAESFAHLERTYEALIARGAETVIPGHGPVCDTATLQRQLDYYRWLVEQVSPAVAAGKDDTEIVEQVAPPADMHGWWRFLQWKHDDSLAKVIRAVRGGELGA